MAVQQPGEGKRHDWRDVDGVTLGIELFEPITQGKQQLRLGRMQVGRGERWQGHQSRVANSAGWLATCRSLANHHRSQSTGVHQRRLPRWLDRSSGEAAARAPRSGWGSLRLRGEVSSQGTSVFRLD